MYIKTFHLKAFVQSKSHIELSGVFLFLIIRLPTWLTGSGIIFIEPHTTLVTFDKLVHL